MCMIFPPAILGWKWRSQFMGAWDFLVLSAGGPPSHKIPRFRWESFGLSEGGGECKFYCVWARGFF